MKGIVRLFIALIFLLGFGIYSVYDVFFTSNPSPYSFIFFVVIGLLILFVVIMAFLDKLSDSYPKSKFFKVVKAKFQKYSEMVMDVLGPI